MSKEEYETYMTSLEGQATGIGVYTTYDQEQNRLRIIEVYHGSGAEEAGLAHGDEIVGAGGKALETVAIRRSLTPLPATRARWRRSLSVARRPADRDAVHRAARGRGHDGHRPDVGR